MSVSKFNSDFSASWKTIPKCSICFVEFSAISQMRRRPMILSCYHNVCEKCVFGNQRQSHLICRQCDTKTLLLKNKPYRKSVEFNYHLNGFIFYKENLLNNDITRNPNSLEFTNTYNNDNSLYFRGHKCSECINDYTKYFCIQCSVPYCISCFNRLHKNGKAFQKHNLSLLERDNTNIIFNIPKYHKKCPQHKLALNQFCQTCKEIICGNCVAIGHINHSTTSLQNENNKYLLQINSIIETVKMAKDTNKKALKDSKFVENKFNQHCDEAIEYVTSYFNTLHSILQLNESKILLKIKENIVNSVGKVKKTQYTLENSLKNLDDLIVSLQTIVDERPNCPLVDIIEKTNNILETIPCQVKFDNFERSPYTISKTNNVLENDLENCLQINCNNIEDTISVHLLTFFGDVSLHLNENTEDIIETNEISDDALSPQNKLLMSLQVDNNNKPKKLTKKQKKKQFSDKDQISNSLQITDNQKNNKKIKSVIIKSNTNSQVICTKRVHVSHIKSPNEFYVQNELFRQSWNEFHKICKTEGEIATTPDYIEINNIYLVYSKNTWYRGKILKTIKNINSYNVFLIDYGISLEIPKQYIRQISDDLQNRPNEAMKCTLIGIKKKPNIINDDANILMTEIIANNQIIDMVVLKEDNTFIVDLIVTENFPTSISDALLFTDMVDKDEININDKELNRNLRLYQQMKKKLIPPITKSFYKTILSETINSRIIPLNIKSPQEFYVTKYDFKSNIEQLSNDLNQTYYKNKNKIFLPRINMPCAVCVKGKWFRARILLVETKLKCKIWLVDYGISETVIWKQLRILDENFLIENEYSLECSLIDIEPLQSNNYSWTKEAITEFKHFMKQSNIQIHVHNTKEFCHKVTVLIIKKTFDINVNAVMVEAGYAISTGAESIYVKNTKINNENNDLVSNPSLIKTNNTELITKKIQTIDDVSYKSDDIIETLSVKPKIMERYRSKIRILTIISPGEFYLHKEDHSNAINKFQKDIQPKENIKLSDDSTIKHNWTIGDNCLVYTKLCNNKNTKQNNNSNKLQWYRGVITNIDHNNESYTIFLRDYGKKIDNIEIDNITSVNLVHKRICDSAIKCHLACVHPTGGMENWSHSSIDELKELTEKFDTISATIQGSKNKNNSIPVILWGMTNEYIDALGPNICKWININEILVNNGLAHLYEKFDKGKQGYLDKEFEETERQLNELWLNAVDNISKVVEYTPEDNIMEASVYLDFNDDPHDLENVISWLPAKSIDKSIFTAIPTYIDDNGYIYLHDARTECVLDKIKKVINEKITNYKKICSVKTFHWYNGQPCLARYHLDNLYYRGEIININSDNNIIQVSFVDYGNIEECKPDDLIKDLCLTKIPIQATKYELDGIVPNTENGKWSRDVLDFVHSIIVMKMCSIRIADNSMDDIIKKCSIRCESDNIIDLLIKNNYAIKKSQVFDKLLQSESSKELKKAIKKINPIRLYLNSSDDDDNNLQENSDDEKDILMRITKPNIDTTENRKDSDYYRKIFEKKELENVYTSIMSGKELRDEPDMDCTYHSMQWNQHIHSSEDEDLINYDDNNDKGIVIDTDDNYKENNDNDKESASIISFNPKETSTVISRFDGLDNFTRSELPFGVKKFYCEINCIRDATNLFISPLLTEHDKNYLELSRSIQFYAKTASPLIEISPNIPCLAIYNEDNLWYRAIIKAEHPHTVDVLYVDYLNTDTIPITKIRKCPQKLLKHPMRTMEVRLNCLKPNPRWRNSDIIRRLSELLNNRKFFVKVIKDGKIPEITLMKSQSNTTLVLQELINERLYLIEGEK